MSTPSAVKSSSNNGPFMGGLFCLIGLAALAGCSNDEGSGPPPKDTTAPTVTLNASQAFIPKNGPVDITVTASEAITTPATAGITVSNGSVTSVDKTDDKVYIIRVLADDLAETLTLTVNASACADKANNAVVPKTIEVAVGPVWASAIGTDGYGKWADLTVANPDNGVTAVQRFRLCPAGTFTMGSPVDEPGRWGLGETQRQVTLTQGFWMADSECTQRMWKAVMNTMPSYFTATGDDGLELPVEMVSWDEIQGEDGFFASLATMQPAFSGRLPTEAQWEYACRAGTTTALYNGPIEVIGDAHVPALNAIAWYAGNAGVYAGETSPTPLFDMTDYYSDQQFPDVLQGTHHVRLKLANNWGIFDMLGNVGEWTANGWQVPSADALVDPTGPGSGTQKVIRGSSFIFDGEDCRSANVNYDSRDRHDPTVGFRLCALRHVAVTPDYFSN